MRGALHYCILMCITSGSKGSFGGRNGDLRKSLVVVALQGRRPMLYISWAREFLVLRRVASSFAPPVDMKAWDSVTADRYHI